MACDIVFDVAIDEEAAVTTQRLYVVNFKIEFAQLAFPEIPQMAQVLAQGRVSQTEALSLCKHSMSAL